MSDDNWQPIGWWRVIAPDGSIWCETSSEADARGRMRPGDDLLRLYERVHVEQEWRP